MSETRIVCRLTIPFDPAPLSPNRILGRHWGSKVIRRAKQSLAQAAFAIWHQAGRPRAKGPVRVSYTVRRGRKFDQDNCAASLKSLSDQLFKGQITPDDSEEYVTYNPVRQVAGKPWRITPEIEVLVEEL